MEIFSSVFLTKVDGAKDSVGIHFANDKIELFVPGSFRVDKNENVLKKDILLFLHSISIVKTKDYLNISNSPNRGEFWPLESFVWIIRDYLENGFYCKSERVYSNVRNGKISWKKTLRNTPIISNGNLVFNEFITSKTSPTNDIVSHIYKICLRQCVNKIGWLFGYNLIITEQPIISIAEMIYIIKIELASTFDDIKRVRFKHMISILDKINDNSLVNSEFDYKIDNYYYVFEQMVDQLFQGITGKEKKNYNPSGYWKLNNKEPKLASNLRPDTICKVNEETYILDAKMYQYGCSHNIKDLPDTQSLQKQITYGDYVFNRVAKGGKVRNAFILPYNKELESFVNNVDVVYFSDRNLAYIGEAYVDWRNEEFTRDHERIFAFLIDFNYLLNNYSQKNEMIKYLALQINEIL